MSKVTIRLLTTLATTIGKNEVEVQASSLKEALDKITAEYGDKLTARILDPNGNMKSQIKIYVNGRDVRFRERLGTALNDGDKILILPAVTGG